MIYLTGDLHGDFERFRSKEMKKLKKGDTLIVCGDFGFVWDGSKKEQSILKKLGKSKYQILFIEGTHDNLDLLSQYPQEEWNGGKVRRISGSLLKLERGEVFELEGKRFFAFGGGESPEMELRAADGTWWQQELPSVEEVCRGARRIAVMENIVDHTNVGALMRSAAALNVDAVLVTPSCGDPLYRRAARVSMGTVFQIPWTRIGGDDKHYWPFTGMQELRDLGFTTVAMALEDDSISLEELVRRLNNDNGEKDHIDKLALIFGTEGDGLSHHTISRADLTVKIPMSHGVDSLNVAASSAVAFYSTAVH